LDESVNLSSDEFSSESDVSDSDTEDIAAVQVWHRVDSEQSPAALLQFPFTGNSGLQVDLSDKSDPLTYLRLFWTTMWWTPLSSRQTDMQNKRWVGHLNGRSRELSIRSQ